MVEKISKEHIYHTNAFSLFLVKHLDRIGVAVDLTAKAIKAGFRFAFVYKFEKNERDKAYKQFCEELTKQLRTGIDNETSS